MKKIVYIALAAFAVATSCSKENASIEDQNTKAEIVTISATISESMTKVAFDPSYIGGKPTELALTWAEGDQIRVYNHANRSQYKDFTLAANSVGKKKGVFEGEAISAASYDVEVINGAFDYASQTQPSDGETTGLKYLASANNIADYSTINFTDFSSVLAITAKMPSTAIAAKIKSVDITASENIFNGGNNLTITLGSVGDADNDGILHFYATLPQGDQDITDGTTLTVHFNAPDTDHTVYTRYIEMDGCTFISNNLNTININATNSASYANASTTDIGTSANPYLIGDKYQMLAMSSQLSSEATVYFKLIDDIDMTGTDWSPLNPDSPYNLKVNFDGNNKTVSHLGGTMFYVFKGSIKNLTLDAPTISTGNQKGGFAQYIQGTDNYVTNVDVCNVATFEAASGNCGGLIGRINNGETGKTSATIVECDVTNVPVNSTGTAGGLIGYVEGVKVVISNCNVTGNTVSTTNHYAGGLIARAAGEVVVSNCHTNMVVSATGKYRIGGLIGWAETGSVEQCYAEGNISGAQYMGGLIGTVSNTAGDSFSISKSCYITGSITPTKSINGGLVGSKEGAGSLSIRNCYSSASIIASGPQRAGGILGNHYAGTSTLENCYFSGRIEINACIGGIVGWVETSGLSVTRCMPFPASLHATQNVADAERYCSGLVVGYANKSNTPTMIVNHCYRTAAIASNFQDYTGVATINVVEDHDFITTAAAIPQRHGLTYGFYHHGKQTDSANLSALVQRSDIGGAWDSSIWNFEQDYPRLNWMLP